MASLSDSAAEPEFTQQYAAMGEPELLALATSYDSLIEPAQTALRAEFARRNLEPPLVEEPPEVSSRNLIVVRRYRDLSEAIVARTVLESAGIFCFLRDENLIRLDWQLSNFIGGLALQVGAQDREQAEELLSQSTPETIAFDAEDTYQQPHCPRCGSMEVVFETPNRGAALASLFVLSLPVPLGLVHWHCNTCDSRWTDGGESPDGNLT